MNLKNIKMKIIKTTVFVTLLALFFAGCVKENFDMVPEKVYTVDFEANTTIAELKEAYSFTDMIKDDVIIKGTVISDDSHGNFYKKIVLQDSTGGIEIQIDAYDLYKKYPVGEMVYVKCKGLIIGDYKGVKQLTYASNGSSGRLPEGVLTDFLYRKTGEGIAIIPKVVKIDELNNSYINTLIELENVEFIPSDTLKTYADPNADASRYLTDFAENTLIVRTSSHADFAADSIPKGNGDLIAVYTVYNSDKQINIRTTDEVDFADNRIVRQYILDEDFPGNLGSFMAKSVLGSNGWYYTSQYDCAVMSGYSGGARENEDWLISPAIDMSSLTDALMTFTHAGSLYGSSWDNVSVQISTDYDGTSLPTESGTWTEIKDFEYPTGWTFISSGGIDMTEYCGSSSVYVAFKYLSDNSTALKWEISSVKIIAQ